METLVQQTIETGDVLEFDADVVGGDAVTAMVLLATDEFLVLDRCDGSTPFVLTLDELGRHRRFEPSF